MKTSNESRTEFVIRNLRAAMPKNWPRISKESGVPEKTIYKIAYRETKDPRSSTLDKLHSYFEQVEAVTKQ
jgi:predicted transcriptional regulator